MASAAAAVVPDTFAQPLWAQPLAEVSNTYYGCTPKTKQFLRKTERQRRHRLPQQLVQARQRILSIRVAFHWVQLTRGMADRLFQRLLHFRRQYQYQYKYQKFKDNHTCQEQHLHLTYCRSYNR